MRLLGIQPGDYQWFAEMADWVVDNRNADAHFYKGIGLRDAVQEVMEIFERHPSLVQGSFISFCKSILEKYSTLAPSFGYLFVWQNKLEQTE